MMNKDIFDPDQPMPIYSLIYQALGRLETANAMLGAEPTAPESVQIRMDIICRRVAEVLDPYDMMALFRRRQGTAPTACMKCQLHRINANSTRNLNDCNGEPRLCPGLTELGYHSAQGDLIHLDPWPTGDNNQ